MMPVLVEDLPLATPVIDVTDMVQATAENEIFELDMTFTGVTAEPIAPKEEITLQAVKQTDAELISTEKNSPVSSSAPAAAGGYLARPSTIYAETKTDAIPSKAASEKPAPPSAMASIEQEELLDMQMQLVERDEVPVADLPQAYQVQSTASSENDELTMEDEMEEQKRKSAERLNKLRNLSFNVNSADPNNEFETVPAYIRRNMELYNNNTQVENFYSSYEVKNDANNQVQLSSFNTFLEGKKPD
jgi:cell division protein FtsZ